MKLDEVTRTDRLTGVRTPVATGAHLSTEAPGTPLDLLIPAGAELDLQEDGLHIVLTGLTRPLEAGRSHLLELDFEHAGRVHADLNVDFTPLRFL